MFHAGRSNRGMKVGQITMHKYRIVRVQGHFLTTLSHAGGGGVVDGWFRSALYRAPRLLTPPASNLSGHFISCPEAPQKSNQGVFPIYHGETEYLYTE